MLHSQNDVIIQYDSDMQNKWSITHFLILLVQGYCVRRPGHADSKTYIRGAGKSKEETSVRKVKAHRF